MAEKDVSYHDIHQLNTHYIRRIRATPILTVDEEYKLAKKWRDEGDYKAVEQLVASHLRLVTKIAAGYRGYGLPMSDLVSEGNVGMMQAMKHFDPERGFRLSTYAMWWIRASIQEYIMQTWSSVKMGTTAAQRRLFFNLRKAKQKIAAIEDEAELTPEIISKLAEKLCVKEHEIIQMNTRMAGQDLSLNTPKGDESGETSEWQDWLVDERDTHEIELIHHDELTKRRALLDKAMEALAPREREIFYLRRLADPPLSLEQVAIKMSLSRERVRQIELAVFNRLQKSIKMLARPHAHHI